MSTASMRNGEYRVGRFVTSLDWHDAPETVRERIVMAVIDTLTAMVAGVPARSTGIATKVSLATFAPGEATLVADRRRLRAEGAAFANAVAANAYDLDDTSVHTWGHPGAQIVPAALAVAEETGATGKELATAVLIGYEVACRQALCLYADVPAAPERDYRGCAAWGAVAAAVVAARLLDLTAEQTRQALGIAEYHAPDAQILRDVRHPGMVKHGHGPAVLTGIMAARLAQGGFTGTPGLLDEERFAAVVSDVGERWLVEGRGIEWKRFACCAWAHPALNALATLLGRPEAAGFDPAAVDRIVVEAHFDSHLLGARLPDSSEAAQFSMAWPLATCLFDGEVGVPQIDERRIADHAVRELAGRIELRRSDELDRLYWLAERDSPEGANAARVVVELRDGRRLDSGVVALPDRGPAWTPAEHEAKFRRVTSPSLPAEAAEALLHAARRLPDLGHVRELTAPLHSAT
ncbi:MAG: MmgE/PrpD family protein [Actinobacteria bacterium]|nr:MmgE/PrpD family protein [Actinomycetota bacterium]